MQNLVTIPQSVSFPRMREIAHNNFSINVFFRFLQMANSPGAWTDFHAKYVKRRVSAQGCAFTGLEN